MQLQQEVERVEAGVGVKKIGVDFKEYKNCYEWRLWDCNETERDKGTWVKVRKGNILRNIYDP